MNINADVSGLRQQRLARVEAHPYADTTTGESRLGLTSRGNSILSSRERDEERVALRVDLDTRALGKGLAQDPAMLLECSRISGAELV